MTGFRPKKSARTEEIGEAARANREVQEVMTDLSREVNARPESEVPTETSVAEITPVSSSQLLVVGWDTRECHTCIRTKAR